MTHQYVTQESIVIRAPISKVWDALTNPEITTQYLFGTQLITDWKPGSPIIYRRVWNGEIHQDKGTVVNIVPEKALEITHCNISSGVERNPANDSNITYELSPDASGTKVTITQDKIATETEQELYRRNWQMVLANLKNLMEEK